MKRGRKPLEEIFTDEQKEFILREYPNKPCCEVAEKLGIKVESLRGYAHRNNIRKSKEYITKIRREAGAKALGHRFPAGFVRQFASQESENKWRENLSKRMKDVWRRERLRVEYGMPQRTKLRVVTCPKKIRLLRFRLRKKGYIIDDKKRIAYWDDNTKRSDLIEQRKTWYTFASVDKRGKNVNDVNDKPQKGGWVPEAMSVNVFFG